MGRAQETQIPPAPGQLQLRLNVLEDAVQEASDIALQPPPRRARASIACCRSRCLYVRNLVRVIFAFALPQKRTPRSGGA
jgi:hypothetical protein